MKITQMSKEDFDNVPYILEDAERHEDPKIEFSSLVIIPTGELHESGFGCMSFVLVKRNGEPIGKIGGGCDVICIDGIGGRGFPPKREPLFGNWTIDCLPCGYLNLWNCKKLFIIRHCVGSLLEVYSEDEYDD